MQKRMISVILCLTLLIGMLPAAVAVVPGMKGGTSTNVGNSEGLPSRWNKFSFSGLTEKSDILLCESLCVKSISQYTVKFQLF